MFQGSNAISMDAKGRIAIPTKCREQLVALCDGNVVITAHMRERCLVVYPLPEWRDKVLPQIQALPEAYRQAARAKRLVLGHAHELLIDGNGRVLLPPTLRQFAALEKKLMLVGLGNKFELWDEDAFNAALEPDEGEMPEAMLALDI